MSSNKRELKVKYTKGAPPKKTDPFGKDILVASEGQWKYPGMVTRVPGGDITMNGVPYPVMAIPNVGTPTMMYPGMNYSFPGSDYVDEIPVAKTGGWLDDLPKAQIGTTQDSIDFMADKILKYEILRGGPGGSPLPQYKDPSYKKILVSDIYPEVKKIMPNSTTQEIVEAMDFIFNTGWDKTTKKITKDPRAYAIQEYYKKYDPSKLDKEGKWSGRKNAPYSFDKEYNETIGKLSENERRILMNKGRDWYYQNINNLSPGVPNPNYESTWKGRIWNTNDFSPFDPNNPKFIKQTGGWLDKYQPGGEKTKYQTKSGVDEVTRFKNQEFLPVLTKLKKAEICATTGNCSEFSTTELANILGVDRADIDKTTSADAWYKKSKVLKNNGLLIYERPNKKENLDWSSMDLRAGDFVSLGRPGTRSSKQPPMGQKSPEGYDQEDFARHSGIIVGRTEKGVPIVRHNYLGNIFDEPIDNINLADPYEVYSIFRHPKGFDKNNLKAYVDDINYGAKLEREYNDNHNISLSNPEVGNELLDLYNKNRKNLVVNYRRPPEFIDEIFKNLLGISAQESNLDNDLPIESFNDFLSQGKQFVKDITPGFINTTGKVFNNIWTSSKQAFLKSLGKISDLEGWQQQKAIALAAKKYGLDFDEAERIVNESIGSSAKPLSSFGKSYGPFKQKNASELWKKKYNIPNFDWWQGARSEYAGKGWNDNNDNYLQNAVGLYIENFEKAKKIYPGKNQEFYHNIATIAHNSPSKAFNKDYVDFFVEWKDNPDPVRYTADYLKKIKDYKEKLLSKPKLAGLKRGGKPWLDELPKANKGLVTESAGPLIDPFMSYFKPKTFDPTIDYDNLRKAVSQVESIGGKLMMNPKSTATGLYGQLFGKLTPDLYKGTREEFAKDIPAQERIFKLRYEKGLPGDTSLLSNVKDLGKEYEKVLLDNNINALELAALTNFLGRQGTRKYLGYVLRDKQPLEKALPKIYGPNAEYVNKTPEAYLEGLRKALETKQAGGWLDELPKAQEGKKITNDFHALKERSDFKGNFLSPVANYFAGKEKLDRDIRKNQYGPMYDLYRYYFGLPPESNILSLSKYRPTISKNEDSEYISINDDKFKEQILDIAKDLQANETKKVSGYEGKYIIDKNIYDSFLGKTSPELKKEAEEKRNKTNAIGRFIVSKGEDHRGKYVSYYDIFDKASGNKSEFMFGSAKPYELYDRIYYDPETNKIIPPKPIPQSKIVSPGVFMDPNLRNGGWLDKTQTGGYTYSIEGSKQGSNYKLKKPSTQGTTLTDKRDSEFPILYPDGTVTEVNPVTGKEKVIKKPGEKATGQADYIPIESVILPANLPFQATSNLGKAGVFALEALNPIGGFKGTPRKLSGSSNVAKSILDNPAELETIRANINLPDNDIVKLEKYLDEVYDYNNLTPYQKKKILDRETYYLNKNNVSVDQRIQNNKDLLTEWENYKKDRVEYFDSPKFRERVNKQYGEMSNEIFKDFKEGLLQNLEKRPYIRPDVVSENAAAHYKQEPTHKLGIDDHKYGHTYYKDEYASDPRIVFHEGRHQLTNAEDEVFFFPSRREIEEGLVHPDLVKFDSDLTNPKTGADYFLSPEEFITRLDELKRDMSKVGYDYKTMDLTPEVLKQYKGLSPNEAISKVTGKPGSGVKMSELTPEQHDAVIQLLDQIPDKTTDSQRLLRWFKDDFLLNQINNKWGLVPPAAIIGAGAMQEKKSGGWLDKYQEGGKKINPNKESWENLGETILDQVPGMNFIKSGNQFIQGNYFQSIGELIKALPQSKFVGDYLLNTVEPGFKYIDDNYGPNPLRKSLEKNRQKMEYVPPKTILPVGKKGGWLDNVK